MLHKNFFFIVFILAFLVVGCKSDKNKPTKTLESNKELLTYAQGFSIEDHNSYKVLSISDPWPDADKSYKYALVSEAIDDKKNIDQSELNGVITTPVKRIVVTSTTHIPALELLGVEQTLVGFPGMEYISSKKTRARINNDEVRELGSNEGINTEVLLELRPDIVVTFGVEGTNKSMELIERAGIPVIYNGDWVEKSPLAKAEWIKFFGLLYNKEDLAKAIFDNISKDYQEAKTVAQNVEKTPSILCGAMYKDIWYLPNGTSPEAQFLNDANTNYLWKDTTESGSLSLSFEAVFEKAKDADIWMSPSYYKTYEELLESNSHYEEFDAFKNKAIYTFSNTTGATGGVLYYELGITRPDLVLKDIIKICHPELLPDYETTFFKPLE